MRRPVGFVGWTLVLVVGAALLESSFKQSDTSPTPIISAPAGEHFQPLMLYVTASTLNVRAQPNASASVLLAVPKGTSVAAVGEAAGWYEVQLTNGSTGWMSAAYLATQPIAADPAQQIAQKQPAYDSDAVVEAIIGQSIASYMSDGRPCPCPYNTLSNGRRCGDNSAYVKPRGRSPLCYPSDVTQAMIDDYSTRH